MNYKRIRKKIKKYFKREYKDVRNLFPMRPRKKGYLSLKTYFIEKFFRMTLIKAMDGLPDAREFKFSGKRMDLGFIFPIQSSTHSRGCK